MQIYPYGRKEKKMLQVMPKYAMNIAFQSITRDGERCPNLFRKNWRNPNPPFPIEDPARQEGPTRQMCLIYVRLESLTYCDFLKQIPCNLVCDMLRNTWPIIVEQHLQHGFSK